MLRLRGFADAACFHSRHTCDVRGYSVARLFLELILNTD
jgi:hypothetical protein